MKYAGEKIDGSIIQCVPLATEPGISLIILYCNGQQIRNTWKVLKCGAGEGWRRSVGPIT